MSLQDEAVHEWVREVGREYPDHEWILSVYDSWHKNPFYTGKPGRHPEDDYYEDEIPSEAIPPAVELEDEFPF